MLIAGLPSNSVRGLSNTPKLSPMDEGPEQSEQPDSPEVSSRENKYKAKTSIYLSIYLSIYIYLSIKNLDIKKPPNREHNYFVSPLALH